VSSNVAVMPDEQRYVVNGYPGPDWEGLTARLPVFRIDPIT